MIGYEGILHNWSKTEQGIPQILDKSYALKNGQGFINGEQGCPENWTELDLFLCPEK